MDERGVPARTIFVSVITTAASPSLENIVFSLLILFFVFSSSLRPVNSKLVSFVRPLYIHKYYDPDDVQKPRQRTVQDRSQLCWWRRDKFRDNWSVVCTGATHSAIIIEKARIPSQHDDKSLDITKNTKKK